MDTASRGEIRVDGYEIFADSETSVATVNEKNYLYRVADDNEDVIFRVNVDYNDPNINNNLVTDSNVTVDVEGE